MNVITKPTLLPWAPELTGEASRVTAPQPNALAAMASRVTGLEKKASGISGSGAVRSCKRTTADEASQA